MKQQKFKIGDVVTWTSQASGVTRKKKGKIIARVPADTEWPDDSLPSKYAKCRLEYNEQGCRVSVSYLVYVKDTRERIYRPRVSSLKLAS